MAMAAMIRIIATTISNSISEKPFDFRFVTAYLGSLILRNWTPFKIRVQQTAEGETYGLWYLGRT